MTALIGKLLLFLGCSTLGISRGVQLNQRTICLQNFRRSLEGLTRELTFSLRPLSELLEAAARESKGSVRVFFTACLAAFVQGGQESWAESWRQALEETDLPLKEEDRQMLTEAGDILGRYDAQSQLQGLRGLLSRIEEQISAAREETHRLRRVYVTVGITAGLFCLIVL